MKMRHIHITISAYFLTDTLIKEKYLLNNLHEKLRNFGNFKKHKEKTEHMCQCTYVQRGMTCIHQ